MCGTCLSGLVAFLSAGGGGHASACERVEERMRALRRWQSCAGRVKMMAVVRTSLQKVVVFLHRLQRMAISSPRYQKLCKVSPVRTLAIALLSLLCLLDFMVVWFIVVKFKLMVNPVYLNSLYDLFAFLVVVVPALFVCWLVVVVFAKVVVALSLILCSLFGISNKFNVISDVVENFYKPHE